MLAFYWEKIGMRVIKIHFWHMFPKIKGNLPGENVYILMYNQPRDATRFLIYLLHLLEK